ncbi:WD40 repeat-like protein [Pleomassaria siparia CBS 279.74]|uniref:WD40 repeat-like protein n=1 Tax=Pleomassaria siparia CBS 279.74 TaxID=1314801 RepID=A0A6G1KN83_9PLEO|nr:WD40 repeat-like protein [Pleomassaria siparia CBS 279.74]
MFQADFMEEYNFLHYLERESLRHGQSPEWASGHPKEWHNWENMCLRPPTTATDGSERLRRSISSALSGDSKLLAVNYQDSRILIYDVDSKELRQELDGRGKLVFAPLPAQTSDEIVDKEAGATDRPPYTLISSVSDVGDSNTRTTKLIIWELDKRGRLLDDEEPVDASAFAKTAIQSIASRLEERHEWSKDFLAKSTLHADFEKALQRVAAIHRRRQYTIINDAALPEYSDSLFTSDGKRMLYIRKDGSEYKSPSVVVWDMRASEEILRLQGHTDAIVWASFSPDGQNIGTVSWDGTMRMHSATTGELIWVTPNSGGQSCTGSFTPDSRHVVWSCDRGTRLQVHDVLDGKLVSKFEKRFEGWCRSISWHPDGQHLALCCGLEVYVWHPFDGPNGSISQDFQLHEDNSRALTGVSEVKWIDDGRKLVVIVSDGSKFVWDAQLHSKELFKRPGGQEVAHSTGFYFISDEGRNMGDMYLSVDGDGIVRYWRVSCSAESWWDKKEEPAPKKQYPETGKYVKVVRPKQPVTEKAKGKKPFKKTKEGNDEATRDAWAERGAELWMT